MRESGLSLVEVMLAMTILSLAGAATMRSMSDSFKSLQSLETISSLDEGVRNLRRTLNTTDELGLNATVRNTPALQSCFAARNCNIRNQPIDVVDSANRVLAGSNVFYSLAGQVCTGSSCEIDRFPVHAQSQVNALGASLAFSYCLSLRAEVSLSSPLGKRLVPFGTMARTASSSCSAILGGGGARLPRLALRPLDGSGVVGVSSSQALPDLTCSDPRSLLSGVDSSGRAVCTPMSTCLPGEIFLGLNPDGTRNCRALTTCPDPRQAIAGLDAGGNPVCRDPAASRACGVGFLLAGFDADGTPRCNDARPCAAGEAFSGFVRSDVNGALTRQCTNTIGYATGLRNVSCNGANGEALLGFAPDGTPVCTTQIQSAGRLRGANNLCDPGQLLVGYKPNGERDCRPLP